MIEQKKYTEKKKNNNYYNVYASRTIVIGMVFLGKTVYECDVSVQLFSTKTKYIGNYIIK